MLSVKKKKLMDPDLDKTLVCVSCSNVPRDLPIYLCNAVHVTCNKCRDKDTLNECPRCQGALGPPDSSSALAYMIDKITHKCKYHNFGCLAREDIEDIVNHELFCPLKLGNISIKD